MSAKDSLIEKINNRKAVVTVIGMGYVGIPLMLRFVEQDFKVIGFDIDDDKVIKLNAGVSYIAHIASGRLKEARDRGFEATSDVTIAAKSDILLICVPTPLNKYREPDLTYVLRTVESFTPHLGAGKLISLESTTYPGTTEEELSPRLASTGLKIGSELFLAYSPEREDPANAEFTTNNIPKICSGLTPDCLEVAQTLYGTIIDRVVTVSSPRVAEMTKLLENIHRAVNIGLVNEMKIVADRMGIDIYEVIDAAATKPFGFVPYYPGPGLGGHCIPIDPFYLTWKAREYGLDTRFIEVAGQVNRDMPMWVLGKVVDALNDRGKALHGSKVLVLGVAYKKNVDDMRESPSVVLMELLRERGALVSYHDPYVPCFPKLRGHAIELESEPLDEATLSSSDCVLLATDHSQIDYDMVAEYADLIVDTRGVYREYRRNVVRA